MVSTTALGSLTMALLVGLRMIGILMWHRFPNKRRTSCQIWLKGVEAENWERNLCHDSCLALRIICWVHARSLFLAMRFWSVRRWRNFRNALLLLAIACRTVGDYHGTAVLRRQGFVFGIVCFAAIKIVSVIRVIRLSGVSCSSKLIVSHRSVNLFQSALFKFQRGTKEGLPSSWKVVFGEIR